MRTAELAGVANSERARIKASETDGEEFGMFTCFKDAKNLSVKASPRGSTSGKNLACQK